MDASHQRIPGELMKMQVSPKGKAARTHYRVLRVWEKKGRKKALLQLKLNRDAPIRSGSTWHIWAAPWREIRCTGRIPGERARCFMPGNCALRRPFTGQKIVLETELPPWCRGSQIKFQDF